MTHIIFLLITYLFFQVNFNIETGELKISSITQALLPDDTFLGSGAGSFVLENGDFIYVDNELFKVFYFNNQGELISQFGREGRGPGDFLEVNDIYVVKERLYLLDHVNDRVQIFKIPNGDFIDTINLDMGIQSNSEIIIYNDEIRILGYVYENEKFIHVFNDKGIYIESYGEFINFNDFMMNTNGRIQLTQLHGIIDESTNLTIYTIGAPYRIFALDNNGKEVWMAEDPILPKPWIDHIVVKPDSYRSRFYPTTFNSEIVGDKLVIYWIDPEEMKSYIDVRFKENGDLIKRNEFDFKQAPISFSNIEGSDSEFFILAKNRETNDLFLYKIIIE